MSRLNQATQLFGRDEGYVIPATPADNDRFTGCDGLVEKRLEVGSSLSVSAFPGHTDLYRQTVQSIPVGRKESNVSFFEKESD